LFLFTFHIDWDLSLTASWRRLEFCVTIFFLNFNKLNSNNFKNICFSCSWKKLRQSFLFTFVGKKFTTSSHDPHSRRVEKICFMKILFILGVGAWTWIWYF
jgi:hypothetical protein